MSKNVLRLPLRPIKSRPTARPPWICVRCLASRAASSDSVSEAPIANRPRIKSPDEVSDYDPAIPSSQRDYRLTKSDFFLKKPLRHSIPAQHLLYSSSDLLPEGEKAQRENIKRNVPKPGHPRGVVVSAGLMDKTVKVRVPARRWNTKIQKYFNSHDQHMVHDPNNSLVVGDVIEMHHLHASSAVHYVVGSIIAPFGKRVEERPPIPTPDERLSAYKEKRFAKLHRRSLRREAVEGKPEAIKQLRAMGLEPIQSTEGAKGKKSDASKAGNTSSGTGGAKLETTDNAV